MKKHFPEVKAALAGAAVFVALPAFAQSTVTLYGVVDNGIGYQSSATTLGSTSGGHSAVKILTGVWLGSRFGLTGAEDLGGGTKAVFQLENGFDVNTGKNGQGGREFGRQAFVGLASDRFGTLTLGHQTPFAFDVLGPLSTAYLGASWYAFHPGNIDQLADTGVAPYDTINAIACSGRACAALPDPAANGLGALVPVKEK